jgi:hypothetical protein
MMQTIETRPYNYFILGDVGVSINESGGWLLMQDYKNLSSLKVFIIGSRRVRPDLRIFYYGDLNRRRDF